MNLRDRIDDVLTVLYDYEYIDVEKFYNNSDTYKMIEAFEEGNDEFNQDLYEAIDGFIKFETNYNSEIGDF